MLNQHAEQFHRILVKHGLRREDSTAADHDILAAPRQSQAILATLPPTPTAGRSEVPIVNPAHASVAGIGNVLSLDEHESLEREGILP